MCVYDIIKNLKNSSPNQQQQLQPPRSLIYQKIKSNNQL